MIDEIDFKDKYGPEIPAVHFAKFYPQPMYKTALNCPLLSRQFTSRALPQRSGVRCTSKMSESLQKLLNLNSHGIAVISMIIIYHLLLFHPRLCLFKTAFISNYKVYITWGDVTKLSSCCL